MSNHFFRLGSASDLVLRFVTGAARHFNHLEQVVWQADDLMALVDNFHFDSPTIETPNKGSISTIGPQERT